MIAPLTVVADVARDAAPISASSSLIPPTVVVAVVVSEVAGDTFVLRVSISASSSAIAVTTVLAEVPMLPADTVPRLVFIVAILVVAVVTSP